MLLAVNIGNSNIRFGIFESQESIISWTINTKPYGTEDEYFAKFINLYEPFNLKKERITKIVIGSVVPPITIPVSAALEKLHGIKPVVVNRTSKSPIQHTSNQMGTDLYANAVAAHELYEGNKIIIDFGTALTFMCINKEGKVLGVSIAPGVNTALDSLTKATAQLPDIELVKPKSILGLDTETCMQSGMVYGFLSMVEGMIERIEEEIGQCFVIATGGLGDIYSPLTEMINVNDRLHTLKGLSYLYEYSNN